MATAHEVHRAMEENFFGAFQRQPSFNSSYSSLTASDLISLPSTRRHVAPVTRNTNIQPPPVQQYKCRPSSDILQAKPIRDKNSPEAEAIDRWFENIQRYEQMLEQVAAASLDQEFKDELQHINQWFRCRSDAERTAALYTVVQNASQIQIRFLITVLQQIANGDPYPAGQETTNESYYQPTTTTATQQQPQHHGLNPSFRSHSVISSESEYEAQKRQMYPPSSSNRRLYSTNKLSSAISEPDDLRRRNRDLFVSRPLGLSHPGPLYEKALAARAQFQAMNGGNATSSASSSIISSSSSSLSNNSGGGTGGLFASPPRLRTSCSTTDLSSSKSLFSNSDWPFPITAKTSTTDENWSFGSLGSRKKKLNPTSAPGSTTSSMVGGAMKKEDTLPWAIQEEEQEYSKLSATISSSLSALEQAQARLRQDLPTTKSSMITSSKWSPPPPLSHSAIQAQTIASSQPISPFAKSLELSPCEDNNNNNNTDDDQSDTSSNREKPLTGLARRRKRSSAARALKDKIAAETVDFELMKDVQNWLRSLRLHKYGHAFVGLDWKRVVRMSDQDMIDAGVNTIGARRKLLKVFENVQRHCKENNVDY